MKRTASPNLSPESENLDQGPVDADWADREEAARKAQSAPPDEKSDEAEDAYGDPKDVHDEGILESLGKAVSSPVRDTAEDHEAARNDKDKS
jgi:hypothetical protein